MMNSILTEFRVHHGAVAACPWRIARIAFSGVVLAWMAVANSIQAAVPFAATQPAFRITGTTATLNGMVVPNGESSLAWFEWGTNASYGLTTSVTNVGSGASVVRISAKVSDLVPAQVYAFRLVASNASGLKFGAPQMFATGKKIAAWGDNFNGQSSVPAGLTQAVATACGYYHSLAIDVTGKATAWGQNGWGQTNVPPTLTNVVAVAGGYFHSLALKEDGRIVGWGDSYYGKTNPPPSATNVIAIGAGYSHSLALKADGTVVVWGNNFFGQTNMPGDIVNAVAIASGDDHSLVLLADGTVRAWGQNIFGEATVPAGLSDVVAIAAGGTESIALKSDGTIVEWGWSLTTPTNIFGPTAVAAGDIHCLALNSNRTVTGWGAYLSSYFTPPAGLVNVSSLSAAGHHNLAISDNTPPIATAATVFGPLNLDLVITLGAFDPNGDALSYLIATLPTNGMLFQYAAGTRGDAIVSSNTPVSDALGRVIYAPPARVFGSPFTSFGFMASDGAIISPPATIAVNLVPTKSATRPAIEITPTSARLSGAVLPSGETTHAWFEWGTNGAFGNSTVVTNLGSTNALVQARSAIGGLAPGGVYQCRLVASNAVVGVLAGTTHRFTTGQRLAVWGNGASGQTNFPAGLTNVTALAAGGSHNLVLRAGGGVLAWGLNTYGQTNVPASVTNAIAVAAGGSHSLALLANGRVLAWGRNNLGQTNVPASLTNAVVIAAGVNHSVAARADGSVVAWGDNVAYQASVPSSATNVIAVAAGLSNSLVLRVDGSVLAWGSAAGGTTSVPAAATNVIAIAAGNFHVLALRADGSVVAWGTNNYGQTQVPAGLSNVVAIAAGANHSLAVKSDGTTVAWGLGTSGQTTVPAGMSAIAAAGGDAYSAALGNAAPTANSITASCYVSHDVVATLSGYDLNKDPLTFRLVSLPMQGAFYQYGPGGSRGLAMGGGNAIVSDPLGRIIFAPAPGSVGTNYALFVANDGLLDSPPAWLSVIVAMPAPPSALSGSLASSGVYSVGFSGTANATYSVWASTNLATWNYLGPASPVTATYYQFQDSSTTNWQQRFYRATAP